jgi:hypothetical protein
MDRDGRAREGGGENTHAHLYISAHAHVTHTARNAFYVYNIDDCTVFIFP